MELLHVYAELVADDASAGPVPRNRYSPASPWSAFRRLRGVYRCGRRLYDLITGFDPVGHRAEVVGRSPLIEPATSEGAPIRDVLGGERVLDSVGAESTLGTTQIGGDQPGTIHLR
jgi:hypothetical protein